jgi:nitrilase
MVSSCHVQQSISSAEELVSRAAAHSPDAIFLPENFAALASDNPRSIAEQESGSDQPIQKFLVDAARKSEAWVFGGTLPIATRPEGEAVPGDRVRAASLVFDPAGRLAARYDKMHMFDVEVSDNQGRYCESDTFEPGTDVVDVVTPFGKVGLSVCYDIRFPEIYRLLFDRHVDFLTVPSAFTQVTGDAHFELLMRARAVENCCFTVAACQGGEHDTGRRTHGHSMVVSPWGEVIGELGRGEDVLIVDVETDQLAELRARMPLFKQRQIR